MNALERFHGTIKFEKVPPPRFYGFGFWQETTERWVAEGMPAGVDPYAHFGQTLWLAQVPVESGFTHTPFVPPFTHETIEESAEYIIYRDNSGITKRERRQGDERSMPQFLKFPVETRSDWLEIKKRLDASTPARYPDWSQVLPHYTIRENPWVMTICGAYGLLRNLFGEEGLAYAFYDQPSLVCEVMEHWTEFNSQMLGTVTENVVPDYLFVWEDMAFKNGPLISPSMAKEFIFPYYARLMPRVKSMGVPCIVQDSDGDMRPLIPGFIDNGVEMFLPLECAAGMDPVALAREYPDTCFWGGIDKRELAKDFRSIEREVKGKLPALLSRGGVIPAVDHSVPPDVSYENYLEYIRVFNECVEEVYGTS